jgi:microcin C transport system permease protein
MQHCARGAGADRPARARMFAYTIRRLLLVIPTLLGIMIINFAIVQVAPGGPIDVVIAQVRGRALDPTARVSAQGSETQRQGSSEDRTRGARGIPPEYLAQLRQQLGFDLPLHQRFLRMIAQYATFDFGTSFFSGQRVVDLVIQKMPVSISLGLSSTLIIYLISIPLGIRKAVRDGSRFDVWTSAVILFGYAIPSFLFAVLLIVLFAGSQFLQVFPLAGLTSDNYAQLGWPGRIFDRLWHLVLPVTAIVIGGFATLTQLTKNSFLDEINKQYVVTARAKGLSERRVFYGHVFRNAMLLVISGVPALVISVLFTGAFLIEIIFSLDGMGLLSYEALINRDYPVVFATLYFFTLLSLVMTIVRDLTYHLVDPRIDFEGRS